MSGRVYRIRSTRPLIWRTPDSLQVGVADPVATASNIPDQAAPLIHALQDGVSAPGFDTLRRQHRVSAEQAHTLLEELRPAFRADPQPRSHRISVLGRSRVTRIFAEDLAQLGGDVSVESSVPQALKRSVDTVVLVADFLLDPEWRVSLGPVDTPHLPVVFHDTGVHVGPLVRPGVSPCLSCRELWQREDPHWLSIGSQLWSTPAQYASRVAASVAAMVTAALCQIVVVPTQWCPTDQACSVAWDGATGQLSTHTHEFHPDCVCRGL